MPWSLAAALAAILVLLAPATSARAATTPAPAPAFSHEVPAAPVPTAFAARSGAGVARRLVVLVNARRRGQGLRPLRWNARLALAARRHSVDMVRRRFFDHTTPDGRSFDSRIWAAGYGRRASWAAGETIAWSPRGRTGAPSILAGWMASPPHRAILMSPTFREIGLGAAAGTPGSGGGVTVTADLGVRR